MHETLALLESLRNLTTGCNLAKTTWAVVYTDSDKRGHRAEEGRLLTITLSKQKKYADDHGRKIHVLALFGEHGRERITSEIALQMVKDVCYPRNNDNNAMLLALDQGYEFTLIPVVNVDGRRIAEQKDDCKRGNLRGVDLNRNYPFGWTKSENRATGNLPALNLRVKEFSDREEEDSGQHPLSEWETRAVTAVLYKKKIDGYVSVHSGSRAVVIPWNCHDNQESEHVRHIAQMVVNKHCTDCLLGSAKEVLHYQACGTGMDFARRLGIKFAATLEVYGINVDSCSISFNPILPLDTNRVVKQWSDALVTVAKGIDNMPEKWEWKWRRLNCKSYGYHVMFEDDSRGTIIPQGSEDHGLFRPIRAGMECKDMFGELVIVAAVLIIAIVVSTVFGMTIIARRKRD